MKIFEVDAEQLLPSAIKELIVEEVVHCRHCTYLRPTAMLIHKDGSVEHSYMCTLWKRPASDMDYCSRAQRIDKEDDG